MPTNRVPLIRHRRPSGFPAEALRLFCELEKVKPRKRFADPRSKRLAALLGLTDQYWSVQHVNDVNGPCHPPHCGAYKDWHTCRAVREVLLETIAENAVSVEEESAAAAG